ncbi:MAG: SDR family NAD(P)-dependent oxidoreductase [Woeseiaceae bacterium]|nr:SDR family NAD(P)-dependent oxidoreductase [Woeseiaceae bacterium]
MIFKDKTVVITGGSEGVGAATAKLFAEAGANLMLVARNKKNLEAVAEKLRDKTKVEIFAMDVRDADACVDVFKKAKFEFGRVDILINNAGFHARGDVDSVEPADLAQTLDVNLRAPVVLSRLALPYFRESGSGVIINVGSLAGKVVYPGAAAYSASKAGLRFFTLALAEELRDEDIKVGLVSPGPINTAFIMEDIDKVSDITFSQPMTPVEEVAQAILDLSGNNLREQAMPRTSGLLATVVGLMPWLGRLMKPTLERKGQRVKKELKAEARAAADNT